MNLCEVSKSVPGTPQTLGIVVAIFIISFNIKDLVYDRYHIKCISHLQSTEMFLLSKS